MSEQSKEEIARDWDEGLARILEANKARGLVECSTCEGIGIPDDSDDDCPTCNGNGTVRRAVVVWLPLKSGSPSPVCQVNAAVV